MPTPYTEIRPNTFQSTRALSKLRKMRKRIRIIPGGTSAGKTYNILPILIDRAIGTPLLEISVVSETMPHLRKGAMKDFIKIMKQTGRWNAQHWHATNSKYTFNNDSYIEFFSVDDESRVHGPRRNILYANEINNIKWETFYQLLIRTDMEVYADYNPTNEFWADTELIGHKTNVEVLRLTYKDNDALAKTVVRELESNLKKAYHDPNGDYDDQNNIKSKYWANWCRVYLFGKVGVLEGAIYTDWEQIQTVPPDARLVAYGLDWGFRDPMVLISCYKYNDRYYFNQEIFQSGLNMGPIADMMDQLNIRKDIPIYCDPSRPDNAAELSEYGYSVIGSRNEIKLGIDLLQQESFFITSLSLDTIKELRKYIWLINKQGKEMNMPVDAFNHAMDAMRYIALMVFSKAVNSEDEDVVYNN